MARWAMRLAWMTDIHLDFIEPAERLALVATVRAAAPDLVVVTGDIAVAATVLDLVDDLQRAIGAPLYFVLGNHDYFRGSIAEVRQRARARTELGGGAVWLEAAGVVRLDARTALVGVDGWGDARLGNPATTPIELSDFYLINELTRHGRAALHARLAELGDAAAAVLRDQLAAALTWAEHVVVATHVPPFRDACWHEGQISDDDWLPYFSCAATGLVLRAALAAAPGARATVLCGHTHSAGVARILPNLEVLTGGADYGRPVLQRVLELSAT